MIIEGPRFNAWTMSKFLTTDIQRVPLTSLHTHPRNPRRGNIPAIAESLKANGFFAPIIAQLSTGAILAGNHTYLAAQSLGWDEIDVAFVDVDDAQAVRIILAANRTADLGEYDNEALASLLAELAADDLGLDGTGYSDDDLDKMLSGMADDALDEHLPEAGDAEREDLGEVWGVIITALDEEHQVELLERFTAEGLKVRAMMV